MLFFFKDSARYVYNGRESTSTSEKEFSIDTISANSSIHVSPDRAFVQLHICPQKTPVSFEIDTGSPVNILPQSIYKSLNIKHPLEAPSHKRTSFIGNKLPVTGMVKLASYHKSKVIQTMFYVVEGNALPLISLQSSVNLGLVQLTYAVESSFNCAPPCIDKQLIGT